MSGFYLAWITHDGERDYFASQFSREIAKCLVVQLNDVLPIGGAHFAVPAARLDEWKAGKWTPS